MRKFFAIFFIVFLFGGCSLLSREAGYPGGNVGYLADRHALFAKGHQQQVNRYYVTLALLAPLVTETVGTTTEAKLSAERIGYLYQNIEKLRQASGKCKLVDITTETEEATSHCSKETAGSLDGSSLSFETLSYEVSESLNDTLKQAFDNLEIRSNASRVASLEPTEILKTILKSRHLVPVLIKYLSAYRDIAVVFGTSIITSCHHTASSEQSKKLANACQDVRVSFDNLTNRTRITDAKIARKERPISEVFQSGKIALNVGLDWKLENFQKAALIHHVNRACKKLDALARIDDESFTGCTVKLDNETVSNKNKDTQKAKDIQKAVDGLIGKLPL